MHGSLRTTLAAALAVSCATALPLTSRAQSDTAQVNDNGLTCFNGYAYTLKGDDYRYTEHHEVKRVHGRITAWNVTYVGADGRTLARKQMDFSDNATVPVYRMTMPRSGYEEGIEHHDGQWTMFKRDSAHAKRQSKPFSIDDPMAADSGFNQLVQQHFDALQSGKKVSFKFVAAGRQSVIDLKANKTGDTTFEGRPAVNFKAELDMFLIGSLVQSLKLTYDPKTERLLEYRGIGNIRNDQGKVYPVKVVYASQMPAVARSHHAPAATCGALDDN